jgi:hypothetical protein
VCQETYKQFVNCMVGAAFLGRAFGIDFSSIRFISARVVKQRSMKISGTKVRVNATVVKVTTSLVEGGKRVNDSALEHDVKVNGQWRWIDTDIKPSEYKDKSCGNGG